MDITQGHFGRNGQRLVCWPNGGYVIEQFRGTNYLPNGDMLGLVGFRVPELEMQRTIKSYVDAGALVYCAI
jgi:hypothetical protein